ncbi:MAG: PAS domain S-box protein [Desulfobacterales bacterium]|nr:PAS domain S-box protein [Desulfobacterales bacterium]
MPAKTTLLARKSAAKKTGHENNPKEARAGSEDLCGISPQRAARLIHELEVHQIELKMQNDEFRRIQGELESTRDRYSELYDFAPSGFATLSGKGLVLEANLTCASLLGHERSLLPGKPFSRFIAGNSQDTYYFFFQNLLETKTPQTCELNISRDGSDPFYVKLDGIVKEKAADPALHILVAMTDITTRRQSQDYLQQSHDGLAHQVEAHTLSLKSVNAQLRNEIEKLKLAEGSLRESEEKYRSLVESVESSIYLVDDACNFLFMNSKHQHRLGLSSSRVKGTTYGSCHSKQETAAFEEKIKTVFDTGRPLSYEYQSERDGNYFVRTLSPVMDGEAVQAVSVISKNITQQKQAEREAHRSRLELAHLERLATLGEFSGALAHELSQPLTAILSNAQAALRLIRGDPRQADEMQAILQDIIADDRRASKFIQHLRTFFKKGEIDRKPLHIKNLIEDVISILHAELILKNVSIETAFDLKLPSVDADYVHLQQVVLNLVLNASESMTGLNDLPRKIVVSTMRENESCLKIGIRDSGRGIDTKDIADIFKPYFTTKKDGMGMGLAICRSIVEAHGGQIWAENNPDRGAAFYFTLPFIGEG